MYSKNVQRMLLATVFRSLEKRLYRITFCQSQQLPSSSPYGVGSPFDWCVLCTFRCSLAILPDRKVTVILHACISYCSVVKIMYEIVGKVNTYV